MCGQCGLGGNLYGSHTGVVWKDPDIYNCLVYYLAFKARNCQVKSCRSVT